MALPALEAMLPTAARAAALKPRPVRMVFMLIPNGVHVPDWTPGKDGALAELPHILQPLQNVRDHLTVLTGLTHDKARPNGDGPGDHARAASAFLTGCQPRKTAGADIHLGISVDQYAAREVGKATRFPSLELGCERGGQAGNCDSGYSCAYSSNIAWRSENTPVAKEVDPRLVFDRLFGNGNTGESAESRAKRDRYQQSILDFVTEDANKLKNQLGVKDQQKLDEYFTSVREIEKRVALASKSGGEAPGGAQRPTGIPKEYDEHLRLMFDMIALAFQGDLTRIVTFMYSNEGSNRPYRNINIAEGHHDLSHHGGDPEKQRKIRDINRFHIQQLAYLLEKLNGMKDDVGSVLDNTMLVYGSAISDGNAHNHDNLPVLLCGKGGDTIKGGQHLRYPDNTPMNNLFLTMLDRAHVPVASLGDSTGRLTNLG